MRSRRTTAALALAVGVVLTAAIAIVAVSSGGSPPAASAASTSTGTVAVARRDLVATDTQSGTLSYADPETAYSRLTGTITWLPAVGEVIAPGQVLFRVDNAPAFLMDGTTPAFRDLSAADTPGPDILELSRDLIALGDDGGGIVADDVWQAATTTGVEEFQYQRGLAVTGSLSAGQVVFLHGSRRITQQLGTVGTTGGGNGSNTPASLTDAPSQTEFVSLTKVTGRVPLGHRGPHAHRGAHPRRTPTQAQQLQALLALLRSETAQLRSARSPNASAPKSSATPKSSAAPKSSATPKSSRSPQPSSAGGSPVAILNTSSSRVIVTVQLPASSQGEARVGGRVRVELPDTSTVGGRITAVSAVASTSNNNNNGGNSSPTIPVTIALSRRLRGAGLDQASVSVSFTQARARNVLAVPVTALLATAGGGYAVQEAAAPHRLLPVTTGLFAAGDVQISGAGITPGLVVTDSQG